MAVMACGIAVFHDDGGGNASVPGTLFIDGANMPLRAEAPFTVGGLPAREYRWGNGSVVIVKIASNAQGVVALLWAPGASRADLATWIARVRGSDLSALVIKRYACEIDPITGGLTSSALTADGTAVGLAVKAAWPSGWKLWAGGDVPPDPKNSVTGGPPTGALLVGAWLA